MASLSLPRVLQLKKNSLDAEREQFEKFQTLAIQKAINAIETPVKEKHVRSAIIGTFQEQSAITYWMVAIRLPLQDNRIVAWKFCHVTHKLLREGHPACLDDSQRHIDMIENLGRLWVHLREGYGRLVHLYCNLLVCKLKFHARNPRFPGNMMLTAEELDAIAENDVNNYFQLCVELFDYMDEILSLQATVFESLGNARANSMTASGQCRLAALIPCAQDASHIYDCNVRLLFRLHASLPPDTLSGHRDRFRQQFRKLSSFYKHASSLQYYRNLLTLPVLPSNPPNFLLQSDFGTYVTPVVSIPEQPPDEVDTIGSLIDTSDTISQATTPDQLDISESRATPSPQPDPVVERDRLIDHLQNELKRMRSEVSQLVQERSTMMGSMREHCARLETQLHTTKTELEEERQKAEILSSQAPQIKQKLTETEEKAKVTDEKFQKLKGAYTQLREEHINLIRQKAEVDKMTATLRSTAAQHESAKMALQQQLNDRIKDVELLQQSASTSEEIEAYKSELINLRSDLEQSRQKEIELETLRANMESLEIEHKTAMKEQEEKLNTVTNELKEATETLEVMKLQKEENENELNKVKEELAGLRDKSGQEYKRVLEEKEVALKQVAELTQQYQQDKEEQVKYIEKLQGEIENLLEKLLNTESKYISQYKEIEKELNSRSQEFAHDLDEKDAHIKQALEQLETLQLEMDIIQGDFNKKSEEQTLLTNEYEDNTKKLAYALEENIDSIKKLEKERDELRLNFDSLTVEKIKLDCSLSEKDTQILELQQKIDHLIEQSTQQLEDHNNRTVELNQQILAISVEKDAVITKLQKTLEEKSENVNELKIENENLTKSVSDLETKINYKNVKIEEILAKLNDTTSHLDKQNNVLEGQQKDSQYKVLLLKDKLQTTVESKDEIINNFKNMLAEKDEKVVSLNVEVKKQVHEISTLKEELEETRAELEIGQNELISLKDEHDAIIERNERNLLLKNQELRSLNDQVTKLTKEKSDLIMENEKISNDFMTEKQVLDNKITDLEVKCESLRSDYNNVEIEKIDLLNKMQNEVENLKTDLNKLRESKKEEIKLLNEKVQEREISLNTEISEKKAIITEKSQELDKLKVMLEELKLEQAKEKQNMETIISDNEREKQILEAKFDHTQREKLNVECELQDLLQHNTVLEADVASLRRQLEDAQNEIEKQRSKLVTSATESALDMTNEALAALERSNVQDSNRAAAELAANALQELASKSQIKGNEETVARSVLVAAHTTAQLSAYVAELSNVATDLDLADKLNSTSRSLLQSTKQCWESVAAGILDGAGCAAARGHVEAASRAAAAADRVGGGARSVDDELADMDAAIEEAASQIEELLAASRAGDSGVKLEVNGKILDACTTLMGAVKILVQDSRKLQNELGDTKTRQKMYRKNPQWSEGLISAAKAVVFAAKLLVTSADEAVGSAGRVEGVSAAAHEVAGSTAQLVAASRARAPPASPGLAKLTAASRAVAAATGALVAAVRAAAALTHEQEALDTSALTLTATRRLEMESKVRSLELETALEAERARLAALRKRHYQLAQQEENGNMTNGKQ